MESIGHDCFQRIIGQKRSSFGSAAADARHLRPAATFAVARSSLEMSPLRRLL